MTLSTSDHSRDSAGLMYAYPVVSRRAGGVSVGINLNPNNACNWACVYCQVPDLHRGAAPAIDLERLESELTSLLARVTTDEWLQQNAPEGSRRVTDIAFSGNGEPTTAKSFDRCVEIALAARAQWAPEIEMVLITNGSMIERPEVARGIELLGQAGGEIWFKIDCAGAEARFALNGTRSDDESTARRLAFAASRCRTLVQTCVFALDGQPPRESAVRDYAALLNEAKARGAKISGILLYGLARPSMQPDAARLGRLDESTMDAYAKIIQDVCGVDVKVSP